MQWLSRIFLDVPSLRPGTAGAYTFAVLWVALALWLRLAIGPHAGQYLTFFPAVMITTLISGVAAGMFSLLLSVAGVAFFLMPPLYSFDIASISDLSTTILFVLVTVPLVVLLAGMRTIFEHCQDLGARVAQQETALSDREDRLGVMVAELQHRTRNLISVVGAIADDTLRTSQSLDEFKGRYHDRLAVLGRAQGLLFRDTGSGPVTFGELLHSELAAQSIPEGDDGRVTLEGPPDVPLRSGTVQMLAIVLHELVTNAVKHGALGKDTGHLAISWRRTSSPDDGRPWLHLDWKETGVAIPADAATGRGRLLIERALPYQCGAKTTYEMEPDGLRCTISLPAAAGNGAPATLAPRRAEAPPLAPC